MERVVECPHCGSEDHCFEEMQDEYSSFMCFNCGFMSDSRFTAENEAKIAADSSILVNKLKFWEEERGIWWFPAVVNMGKLGIIFPEIFMINKVKYNVIPIGMRTTIPAIKLFLNFAKIDFFMFLSDI